jgi:hypothetical protein
MITRTSDRSVIIARLVPRRRSPAHRSAWFLVTHFLSREYSRQDIQEGLTSKGQPCIVVRIRWDSSCFIGLASRLWIFMLYPYNALFISINLL